MLDIARLRLLRAVVATGSIRASAAVLGYTPSAVSQQLAALQRETGLRLLERAGRGVEPTAAARTLVTEAETLFAELSRVEGVVGDLRAGRVGSLSIGYFGSAGASWLPPIVSALRTEFPELRLNLRMMEARETGPDPDIEIFVEHPGFRQPTPLTVRHLTDDPYLAVVHAGDPLARCQEVPLAELAERPWVDNDLGTGACRDVLIAACAEAGFAPRFAIETHDYTTAMSFVATGIGITVIPRLGIGTLPAGLRSVPIVAPTPVRRLGVAVKTSAAHQPAVLRVLELLEAVVQD